MTQYTDSVKKILKSAEIVCPKFTYLSILNFPPSPRKAAAAIEKYSRIIF